MSSNGTSSPSNLSDVDSWANDFFAKMMEKRLSVEAFEETIRAVLSSNQFVFKAPGTAQRILALIEALGAEHEAGYGARASLSGATPFRSHWLVGQFGIPGAVHIGAPPEQSHRPKLADLNRPLHRHDSGRIGLITTGHAIFHFVAMNSRLETVVVDCPVEPGDLIFWPAWTPHTFDACKGFSLLSAMASYVSPREDGFVHPLDATMLPPDSMMHVHIGEYLSERMNLSF